ncbi:MAG: FAD-dependent oxidoreductase [Candidatus Uhrbacteria bacterium]
MENPVLKIRSFQVKELVWETAMTFTLVLVPQDPADMVAFKPGQWIYLHLFNADGSVWARSAYSIASAPEASQEVLRLGIKVHGDFTKKASQLMPDDVVGVQGPFGVYVLPEGENPLVMFAGGVGVTPLLSMIRSLVAQNVEREVTLFYSNALIEETAYFEELDSLAKRCPWFKPVFILTQGSPNPWPGESRRLDGPMLDAHVSSLEDVTFLMCGPKPFMDTVKLILEERGVDTRTRLKQELFG